MGRRVKFPIDILGTLASLYGEGLRGPEGASYKSDDFLAELRTDLLPWLQVAQQLRHDHPRFFEPIKPDSGEPEARLLRAIFGGKIPKRFRATKKNTVKYRRSRQRK